MNRREVDGDEVRRLLGIPFSDEQMDAIRAPLEPGVIIAGAGAGKTAVMAARVVWLVASGLVRPEQVLGLTFTRKAAGELAQRVGQSLERAGLGPSFAPGPEEWTGVDEVGEPVVMTYDAFAADLVAQHGLRIGVERDVTMLTDATRYRLAGRVVVRTDTRLEALSGLRPETIAERLLALDQGLASHLVSVDDVIEHAHRQHAMWAEAPPARGGKPYKDVVTAQGVLAERLELAQLVGEYRSLKRELGVVEFADQMQVAARLVREVPVVGRIARENHAVVLLDEYQDTSAAQVEVLRRLFSGSAPDDGRGHPVTAVGDPFQAIYGWRGAAAANIGQFPEDFPATDGTRASSFTLAVNRRSAPAILDAANLVASDLRADAELEQDRNGARAGAAVRPLEGPVPQDGEEAEPGVVRAASFLTAPEEVGWLVDDIIAQHDRVGVRWGDMAVLARRNSDVAAIFDDLSDKDVPAEIVGLGGLLALPEIRDVVSMLRLVHDVTANPDLVGILTGPRWRIGPRDLALLGRRAQELVEDAPRGPASAGEGSGEEPEHRPDLAEALDEAAGEADPAEVVSLADALASPGSGAYSEEARERFDLVARELDHLRAHASEPLLDLVRRVIALIGVDIEVEAMPEFAVSDRRMQLLAFCDAVAEYVDIDGDATLAGLLAWFDAEEKYGVGLERRTPSDGDSVKLLTVHKAKGLEWPHVYVPGLVGKVFPSDSVTDNWTRRAETVPAELRGDHESIPQLQDATKQALDDYHKELQAQQRLAEDRLAYVAMTRAKGHLTVSMHHWGKGLKKPRAVSPYFEAVAQVAFEQGGRGPWVEPDEVGDTNPVKAEGECVSWPVELDPETIARRREAADAVARFRAGGGASGDDADLTPDEAVIVAGWDADAERLIEEARRWRHGEPEVAVPHTVSVSDLLRARRNTGEYVDDIRRPMPRRPAPRARIGTRFHEWVEQYYVSLGLATVPLVDLDDVPDRGDPETADERDLAELARCFATGRYAEKHPLALEQPFSIVVEGQRVHGRIDAIFTEDTPQGRRYQVVDWKTGAKENTDPGQLALYQMACAELHDVPLEHVDAVFHHVRTDRTERPELPSTTELMTFLRRSRR